MTRDIDLSVQLYSLRNDLGPKLGESLARLAALGLSRVEPYDITTDPAGLRRALDQNGLSAPTAHSNFLGLDRERLVAAAQQVGVSTLLLPWVDPATFEDRTAVEKLAARVNDFARFAASHGLKVGYHNHEFEFSSILDGRPAWEIMVEAFDDDVVVELDTYWASVGGADVFELIPRFADRVRYIHVNNEPPEADDPPTLGVPIVGRLAEVIEVARPYIDLAVLEIVVDSDVFPYLESNVDYFAGVVA